MQFKSFSLWNNHVFGNQIWLGCTCKNSYHHPCVCLIFGCIGLPWTCTKLFFIGFRLLNVKSISSIVEVPASVGNRMKNRNYRWIKLFDVIIDYNRFINIYLLEANKSTFLLKLTCTSLSIHHIYWLSDKKLFVIYILSRVTKLYYQMQYIKRKFLSKTKTEEIFRFKTKEIFPVFFNWAIFS